MVDHDDAAAWPDGTGCAFGTDATAAGPIAADSLAWDATGMPVSSDGLAGSALTSELGPTPGMRLDDIPAPIPTAAQAIAPIVSDPARTKALADEARVLSRPMVTAPRVLSQPIVTAPRVLSQPHRPHPTPPPAPVPPAPGPPAPAPAPAPTGQVPDWVARRLGIKVPSSQQTRAAKARPAGCGCGWLYLLILLMGAILTVVRAVLGS